LHVEDLEVEIPDESDIGETSELNSPSAENDISDLNDNVKTNALGIKEENKDIDSQFISKDNEVTPGPSSPLGSKSTSGEDNKVKLNYNSEQITDSQEPESSNSESTSSIGPLSSSTSLPNVISSAMQQNMCSSSSMLMNIANQSQENLLLQKQQPYLQNSFMQTLLALNSNAATRPTLMPFMEG